MTEKEFLVYILDNAYEDLPDFDEDLLNQIKGRLDYNLKQFHKKYYEVEFIRKEEKEEWQEKGGDNLC